MRRWDGTPRRNLPRVIWPLDRVHRPGVALQLRKEPLEAMHQAPARSEGRTHPHETISPTYTSCIHLDFQQAEGRT
jgi:hypothetical protein